MKTNIFRSATGKLNHFALNVFPHLTTFTGVIIRVCVWFNMDDIASCKAYLLSQYLHKNNKRKLKKLLHMSRILSSH